MNQPVFADPANTPVIAYGWTVQNPDTGSNQYLVRDPDIFYGRRFYGSGYYGD